MSRTPVAYLRRSTADAGNPGDVSREVQEQAIRDLAHADGHNGDVRLYVDWARSADEEKEARRTAFRAMLAAVERGEVSIIYAYALDRLARSTVTFAKLLKAAKDQDVRVVTQREGDLSDTGNPMSWAFGFLVSFFAEFELRMAKLRAASVAERRVARGDHFGKAPYGHRLIRNGGGQVAYEPDPEEPLELVLQAAREAGSVLGAARLLEAQGIPAPYGGAAWSTASLTMIIERHAPELLNRAGPSGRRVPGHKLLSQLVRCHCGNVMTPNGRGGLYCYKGTRAGSKVHGIFNVSDRALLPWIVAEAARLRLPEKVQLAEQNEERRAELAAERERLGWAMVKKMIPLDAALARQVEIDTEVEKMGEVEDIIDVPDLDWSWEPKAVNEVLRAMWDHVELDADMRPIRAEWRVPAWRA